MLLNRRLATLVRLAPWPVAATITLACLASAMSVVQWLLTAKLVTAVLSGSPLGNYRPWLLCAAGAVVLRSLMFWFRDQAATRTAETVKTRLRTDLLDHLERLGPGHTIANEAGALRASIADGVEQLDAYTGFYLPQAAVAILTPVVLVSVLLVIDVWVGSITGVCVVLVLCARPLWQKVLGDRARAHWVAYSRFSARIHDALQGMSTLKTLGASDRHGQRLSADAADLYRATLRSLMAGMGVYVLTAFVMGLGTAVSTAVGALRFADGHISLYSLLLVLFLSAECFRPLQELQNYWHEGFGGLAAAHGIFGLLDTKAAVEEPKAGAGAPHDLAQTGTSHDLSRDAQSDVIRRASVKAPKIEFDNVSFIYPGSESFALANVSFTVQPGQTLALVGKSGSGKSTVINMLLRFFDPTGGSVQINDISLRDLPLAQARSMVSSVSQDSYLFHGTIEENLRLASANASDALLRQACESAGIADAIASWPDRYQTLVGERGLTLSGGERQRIAIARALLHAAPILVLDEATSSVDGVTEAAVQTALLNLAAGRTTVVIAHRLSTVATADHIVVLDKGSVVEQGSPRELAARQGAWARLLSAQMVSP